MTDEGPKRLSVAYFPSREAEILGGHAYLLSRDIPLGILPIGGTSRNANFKVELSSPEEDRTTWLTKFLDFGRYERHALDESLVEFVETSAEYISNFGEVFFEILADADGAPLELAPLPPGRVMAMPRSYRQVVPKKDREEVGKSFASIPRNRIWRLSLPAELGSARAHRRLLRRLAALSSPSIPSFALGNPLDQGRSVGYEFTAHREAADRLMERATRRWGTTMSVQRPVGDSNEYFFISRRLEFSKAQALLREHLVSELNALLKRLAVEVSVEMSGTPTARDISVALRRLHQGEISFAEALDSART